MATSQDILIVANIESIFRKKLMREITREEEANAVRIMKKSWASLTRTTSHGENTD